VTLLEALDLVGQLALAPVIQHDASRALAFQDGVQVGDAVLGPDRQEAQHRLFQPQHALELGDHGALVQVGTGLALAGTEVKAG
jgi:hypothetical protein